MLFLSPSQQKSKPIRASAVITDPLLAKCPRVFASRYSDPCSRPRCLRTTVAVLANTESSSTNSSTVTIDALDELYMYAAAG